MIYLGSERTECQVFISQPKASTARRSAAAIVLADQAALQLSSHPAPLLIDLTLEEYLAFARGCSTNTVVMNRFRE